jgi:hypothetical protein
MVKKYKTFKEYYENEEFRKKHLIYVNEKVECENCKQKVSRCNLKRHKTSSKCISHMPDNTKITVTKGQMMTLLKNLFQEQKNNEN